MPAARTLAVLKAVVSEYVDTVSPVGSKAIVEHHNVGVSPATIRNDLAKLENTGHLVQPHVSAGRVPTELGYRTVVEQALAAHAIASAELPPIAAPSVQEALKNLAGALAQMTNTLAVVSEPLSQVREVARISLVPLPAERICLVVVCDDGSVSSETLAAPGLAPELVASLEAQANALVRNRSFEEMDVAQGAEATVLARIVDACRKLVLSSASALCVRAGVSNLIDQPEFENPASMRTMAHAVLENDLDFDALVAHRREDLIICIGHEHANSDMQGLGVVAKEYTARQGVGFCACVGPVRMDYPSAVAGVSACAQALKDLF
jgi:heat-inducible transcriptional repressor